MININFAIITVVIFMILSIIILLSKNIHDRLKERSNIKNSNYDCDCKICSRHQRLYKLLSKVDKETANKVEHEFTLLETELFDLEWENCKLKENKSENE